MSKKPTYEELEQRIKELEKEAVKSKQTEETLRETVERFRTIYEESPIGIEIYDSKGQLLHVNKACLNIFGIVDDRQIKGFRLFDDPNLPDKEKSKLRKGKMVRYEATFDFDLVKKHDLYDTTKSGIATLDVVITPLASKGNDGPGEYLVQVQDDTERKQAEEALQSEIDKLETITQNIGAGLCIISKDYRTLWANQVLKQIFGEVEGKVCYSTYNQLPDICPNCGVREVFETGKDEVTHEEVGKDANGQTIWSEIIATPIRDKEGNIVSALELVVPITKRKQAEEELKRAHNDLERRVVERTAKLERINERMEQEIEEHKQAKKALRLSEEKYRMLVETMNDGLAVYDKNNLNTYANEKFCQMLGYSVDVIIGRPAKDFLDEDNQSILKEHISKRKKGEQKPYELTWTRKDGQKIYSIISPAPIFDSDGQYGGSFAVITDITEINHAKKMLQESEAFTRAVLDNLPIGIAVNSVDPTVKFEYMNDNFPKYYRTTKEALADPDAFWNAVYEEPKFREEIKKRVLDDCASGCPERMYWVDVPITRKGYETSFITARNIPIPDKQLMISTVWDVTERKRAEEEQARLATAIEQASESIIISDRPGTIQYVNPAFELISGFNREEIVGQNFRILKSDKHDEAFYKEMYDIISRGNIWAGSITNRMKDGTLREFETRISPVHDSLGKIINFVSVNRDVTQEVALEAQLQQAQKIQSIGTLAGGIAHDFNNILYPIIGYTEMAIDDVPEDSLIKRNLEEVLTATKRARDLVQQILTFSRQSDRELKPLKFQSIVKEAMKLLRASIPSTITISQNINNDCGVIRGDQTQIHQIIMNLCTNAYQTMEETGGQLELSLDEIAIGPDEAIYKVDMKPGKYARLTVSDTGHGMEPDVMERIFDPYFTTKEPGKGTGLGLSVVHGIVNTHGGHISVSSEPGEGTKFDVYLPLFESAEIEAETVSPEPLATGEEHILLVDDENQIVDVVRQMLERLGYQVTVRTSSIEALEAFRASPDKFDLVITDLTMPNMTGDKLSGELMNIRSDIPIILCTGFSEKMSEERANALGLKGFLMKPVIINALAKTVREVLDKS